MKKSTKSICMLICLIVLILSTVFAVGAMGLTSSSYVTTATQYGTAGTTTPAKLSGEVKLSFSSASKNTDDSNYFYFDSSYASSSGKNYAMKIENSNYLTDYYGDEITSSNAVNYFDFYGAVKTADDYGTLTYTDTSSNTTAYKMPLVTEWTVGSKEDGNTTLTITPFSEKITVTVYFTMGYRLKSGSSYVDRATPYSAFYFNGEEITYDATNSSNTSTGITKCDNQTAGMYSYAIGKNASKYENKSSQELYKYTIEVDAETAINISTATQSQAMIFLVSLSPATSVSLVDSSSATSKVVALNATDKTISLTATATIPSDVTDQKTAVFVSSNTSVVNFADSGTSSSTTATGTSSGTTYTYSVDIYVTVTATGTAQITLNVCGATAVYTVYVEGVAIKNSVGNVVTSAYVYLDSEATFTAEVYATDTTSGSYLWSLTDISNNTTNNGDCVSITNGSDTSTVTLKGSATVEGTAKLTLTYGSYTATCAITVAKLAPVNAEVNVTTLVTGDEESSSTLSKGKYSTDITLYEGTDGTTVIAKANSDKTVSIAASTKTTTIGGESVTFKYVLKTGGATITDSGDDYLMRGIQITTVDEATITVYMVSSGSSVRTVNLYDSGLTSYGSNTNEVEDFGAYTYSVSSAGTYYLVSPDGGINIYYISITYPTTSISVEDSGREISATYTVGDTTNLEITLTAVHTKLDSYAFYWESSDTSIATVANASTAKNDGSHTNTVTVTTKKAGTVIITVTAGVTSYYAVYTITVNDYLVPTATIGGTAATSGEATIYVPATSGTSLGSTTADMGSTTTSSQTLTWETSDASIATVSYDGTTDSKVISTGSKSSTSNDIDYYSHSGVTVNAVSAGTATITVTAYDGDGNATAVQTYDITVKNVVSISGATSVLVGSSITLTASVDSNIGTISSVSWSSSNTDVATVDSGTVTGKAAGTVTITATATMSNSATYKVTYEVTVVDKTITYTINSSASASANVANGTSPFDASSTVDSSILSISGVGIVYDENNTYFEYSSRAEFKNNRYAILIVGSNTTITSITVYASATNTNYKLYITTSVPSSSTPSTTDIKCSGSCTGTSEDARKFSISTTNLGAGTYYIWASNTVRVYAIKITYSVTDSQSVSYQVTGGGSTATALSASLTPSLTPATLDPVTLKSYVIILNKYHLI